MTSSLDCVSSSCVHPISRTGADVVANFASFDQRMFVRGTNGDLFSLYRRFLSKKIKIRLRVLEFFPVQVHHQPDGVGHSSAFQLCRACVASSLGSREENHHVVLRIANDLLGIFEARRVGEVISVVAHQGACLDGRGKLIAVLHADFIRSSGGGGDSPTRFGAPLLDQTRNLSWRHVLGLSHMLCDPSISETGFNEYFRVSMILSCVILQSQSTTVPVHVLAVGVETKKFFFFFFFFFFFDCLPQGCSARC